MSESKGPLPLRVATVTDDADRAALERIARGELGALDDLYERYKTMAYSIAYRITNDATLAEDVVQDAFLGAWRNAARYVEGRGSVKTWLLSIVHHRAIDAVRRRRATVDLPESTDAPPAALRLPDVWAEVSASLDAAEVRAALASLTDVQREAIELAYFGGLTQVEIADRTGTPLGHRQEPDAPRAARHAPGAVAMTDQRRPAELTHDEVRDLAASFVLGALDDAEMAAVREHLATCAEPHPRSPSWPASCPCSRRPCATVEPPVGLKDRIMAAAAADLEARRAAAHPERSGAAGCTPAPAPT